MGALHTSSSALIDLNKSAIEVVQAFLKEARSASDNCSDVMPILTFNEKIQWRKYHDRRPILPVLTDKVLVRHFAAARGVRSAPLLYHGTCASLPRVKDLPSNFAFKASHLSGGNLLVVNGNIANGDARGQPVSDDILLAQCQLWLGRKWVTFDGRTAYVIQVSNRFAPSQSN